MNLKQAEKIINIKARLYQKVQEVCKELLKTHPLAAKAREYLSARVSSDNQEKFDFGYFPDDDNLEPLLEKIPERNLKALGLIYPYHVQNGDYRIYVNKSLLNQHNLTMPYRDIYGNIKALVGRTILPEDQRKIQKLQKYKYTRFSKSLHLFGLYQAKEAILQKKSIILVEGQFDCITCHEYGIHNVVALGGSSLSKRQFQLLNRYADKIYLLLDKDLEGQKAVSRIVNKYSKQTLVEPLEIPGGYKDVDEYLRHGQQRSHIFDLI